jgi:hypothetical protein
MILSFKKQFENPIIFGSKIHSIRLDPHARWAANKKIHMATGVRTKNYKCFLELYCISVQAIQIQYFGEPFQPDEIKVIVDGKPLDSEEIEKLAINDGFKDTKAFFKWFDSDFQGKIIHWTSFKY